VHQKHALAKIDRPVDGLVLDRNCHHYYAYKLSTFEVASVCLAATNWPGPLAKCGQSGQPGLGGSIAKVQDA
jgi:hypothetical protein